jgi:hypothetical protein
MADDSAKERRRASLIKALEEAAANAKPLSDPLRCQVCGDLATMAVSKPNRAAEFYCEAHVPGES